MTDDLTKAQWRRRALKAEAELAQIQKIRGFEHELEMSNHREVAAIKVALKEITEVISWAKEQAK